MLHTGNLSRQGRSAPLYFGAQARRTLGSGAFDLGLLLLPKARLLQKDLVLRFEIGNEPLGVLGEHEPLFRRQLATFAAAIARCLPGQMTEQAVESVGTIDA